LERLEGFEGLEGWKGFKKLKFQAALCGSGSDYQDCFGMFRNQSMRSKPPEMIDCPNSHVVQIGQMSDNQIFRDGHPVVQKVRLLRLLR
jgi:hypothetical protein